MSALPTLALSTVVAVDATDLKAAITRLKPIIEKYSNPALGCILVDATSNGVLLTTTNIDDTLSIRLNAVVTEPGSMLVPFALINKLLSVHSKGTVEFAGPVTPEANGTIRCKNVTLEFDPIAVTEWPTFNAGDSRTIDLNLDAIADILPAVSKDERRPILCSVLVENGTYVGTDSYRLQLVSTSTETGDAFLIPRSALTIATKFKGIVSADVHDRAITIRLDDNTTLVSRLVEGTFPNYKSLIPKAPAESMTFTSDMVDSLKALAKLSKTDTMRVSQHADGVLALSPIDDDVKGTITTPGTLSLSEPIGFNPTYLLSTIVGTSANVLQVIDALKPMIVREPAPECGVGAERVRLIMPVRLVK